MTPDSPEPRPDDPERDDAHPNQPGSDEADLEKETTPAGVAGELEEMADETGATTSTSRSPDEDAGAP